MTYVELYDKRISDFEKANGRECTKEEKAYIEDKIVRLKFSTFSNLRCSFYNFPVNLYSEATNKNVLNMTPNERIELMRKIFTRDLAIFNKLIYYCFLFNNIDRNEVLSHLENDSWFKKHIALDERLDDSNFDTIYEQLSVLSDEYFFTIFDYAYKLDNDCIKIKGLEPGSLLFPGYNLSIEPQPFKFGNVKA